MIVLVIGETPAWGVKMMAVSNLITTMFAYSAMKIRAKVPLPYSVLNPETSSDSPSAKSNGARFVSAKIEINHMTEIIGIIMRGQETLLVIMSVKLNVCEMIRMVRRRRVILTS